MKVKILGIRGYNFKDKTTGEMRQGATLRVVSALPYNDNDNNGNFEYGCRCENKISLPRQFWNLIPELTQAIGTDHVYRLVKEKQIGDSFETLTELELLE